MSATVDWLHSRLGTDDAWSAASIAMRLNPETLASIAACFPQLDTAVKAKVTAARITFVIAQSSRTGAAGFFVGAAQGLYRRNDGQHAPCLFHRRHGQRPLGSGSSARWCAAHWGFYFSTTLGTAAGGAASAVSGDPDHEPRCHRGPPHGLPGHGATIRHWYGFF
jgi:hypothetical protein